LSRAKSTNGHAKKLPQDITIPNEPISYQRQLKDMHPTHYKKLDSDIHFNKMNNEELEEHTDKLHTYTASLAKQRDEAYHRIAGRGGLVGVKKTPHEDVKDHHIYAAAQKELFDLHPHIHGASKAADRMDSPHSLHNIAFMYGHMVEPISPEMKRQREEQFPKEAKDFKDLIGEPKNVKPMRHARVYDDETTEE
jgi:hypothetical protein